MSRGFYVKLALQNIRKNERIYLPYFLMCTFITAMYYIIYSLSIDKGMEQMYGGRSMGQMLGVGCGIVGFFALVFLFYINSFLMKRRKKEFGLYSILGLEKRHMGRVVFWENILIAVFSIGIGILTGILLNKLVYLGVVQLFQADVPLGFEISVPAIYAAVKWLGVIQLLIFLNGLRQIWFSNPIELLHGEHVGEREPKTKVVMAILGFLSLGIGYYLAVTTTNPVAALLVLMAAIILVMIGTYLTFTAGSIAVLKLLRKKKSYYYQTRHFVAVSGMIYRMKQNAVGLANIAILSTGVLLMISTTLSLYMDLNNIVNNRYPRDITISGYYVNEETSEQALRELKDTAEELQLETDNLYYYSYISFAAMMEEDVMVTEDSDIYGISASNVCSVYILNLEEYNRIAEEKKELADGEILLYCNRDHYEYPEIKLLGKTYTIKETLKDLVQDSNMSSDVVQSMALVVKDQKSQEEIGQLQQKLTGDGASAVYHNSFFGIDIKGTSEQKAEFKDRMAEKLEALPESFRLEERESGRAGFLGTYGGMFFIGIFLSLIFVVATVLIIYYKQISEGYDDKDRFQIMQKVGMDRREIRKAINSQVLIVFFLPLVTAGIHVAFAFPIMERLMLMLGLNNRSLYLILTGACFLMFAVFYGVIYKLTARVYYKIVS